jgi:hypothetical protein
LYLILSGQLCLAEISLVKGLKNIPLQTLHDKLDKILRTHHLKSVGKIINSQKVSKFNTE